MKRLLVPLVLMFAMAGCTGPAETSDPPTAPATNEAPAPEAMGPGDYAFVTSSGAEGVVSIPSIDGATSVAVSIDNSTGTDPVTLTSVTILGTDGREILYTNPAGAEVPALGEGNLVFRGAEIPSSFDGVSVQEFEGTSVSATPAE